jgi:hypothetical protein
MNTVRYRPSIGTGQGTKIDDCFSYAVTFADEGDKLQP